MDDAEGAYRDALAEHHRRSLRAVSHVGRWRPGTTCSGRCCSSSWSRRTSPRPGRSGRGEAVAPLAVDEGLREGGQTSKSRVVELMLVGNQSFVTDDPIPTPRVRQILAAAHRNALQRGHPHLGVEHLVLAIIDDGASLPAQAISATGASLTDIRDRIEAIMDSDGYRGGLPADDQRERDTEGEQAGPGPRLRMPVEDRIPPEQWTTEHPDRPAGSHAEPGAAETERVRSTPWGYR